MPIRPKVYYAWLKDFMEARKARLQADTVRDAAQVEVERLRREIERLKRLVAELSLEVLVLKKTSVPELRLPDGVAPRCHPLRRQGVKSQLVCYFSRFLRRTTSGSGTSRVIIWET